MASSAVASGWPWVLRTYAIFAPKRSAIARSSLPARAGSTTAACLLESSTTRYALLSRGGLTTFSTSMRLGQGCDFHKLAGVDFGNAFGADENSEQTQGATLRRHGASRDFHDCRWPEFQLSEVQQSSVFHLQVGR